MIPANLSTLFIFFEKTIFETFLGKDLKTLEEIFSELVEFFFFSKMLKIVKTRRDNIQSEKTSERVFLFLG